MCSPRSGLVVQFLRYANICCCPRFCSVRCYSSGQDFKGGEVSALTGGSQNLSKLHPFFFFSSAIVKMQDLESVIFLEWDQEKIIEL